MNALGKKWMAKELYEACPICDGEGHIASGKWRGLSVEQRAEAAENRGMIGCPECEGECYTKTGYTAGEVERLRAERDRFKGLLEAATGKPANTTRMGEA